MKYILLDTCVLINCTLMNATDTDPDLLETLVERMREQGVKLLMPEVVQFEYERKVDEELELIKRQTKQFRDSIKPSILPSPDVTRIHETLDKIDADRIKAAKRAQDYFAKMVSDSEVTVSIPLDGDTVAEAVGYALAGKKPSHGLSKGLLDPDSLIVASLARFAHHSRLADSDTILICSDNHTDFARWDEDTGEHILADSIERLFSCKARYYRSLKLLLEKELLVALKDDKALMEALKDYNQRLESLVSTNHFSDAPEALEKMLYTAQTTELRKMLEDIISFADDYDVGPFTDIALEWGDRLWKFLNRPKIVNRMTSVSDSGKPAAGAIGEWLLYEFGNSVREDRVKQFIGCLIKQVMERQGYILCGKRYPTPDDPLFTSGSIYRKE